MSGRPLSCARDEDVAEMVEEDELDAHVYCDSAVVIGLWHGVGRNGSAEFNYQARFNSVWLRDGDGVWRNIVSQSAEITA